MSESNWTLFSGNLPTPWTHIQILYEFDEYDDAEKPTGNRIRVVGTTYVNRRNSLAIKDQEFWSHCRAVLIAWSKLKDADHSIVAIAPEYIYEKCRECNHNSEIVYMLDGLCEPCSNENGPFC